jgi:glycosyltransferase involved in cell wall biosynthesis
MRLLILTFDPPSNVGGIEGRAVHYTRELLEMGVYVEVAAFSPAFGESSETFENTWLHKLSSDPLKLTRNLRYLAKLMSRKRIDSVFVLSGALTLLGFSLLGYCRFAGVRTLVFFYGKDILTAKGRGSSLLLVPSSILSDRVAVNSSFTAKLLPGWIGNRAGLLYPAVDSSIGSIELAERPKSKIVLFVGRLVERKGVDTLLESFRILLNRMPDSKLVIVGGGPDEVRLSNLASQLGLERSVEMTGPLRGEPLFRWYSKCNVLVLPARTTKKDTEGFGTVFLEAGAFSKPVIGTKSGGIPEAVEDGKTGFLVPEDDADKLAERMFDVLSDERLASRLGSEGKRRVEERFSWNRATLDLLSQF